MEEKRSNWKFFRFLLGSYKKFFYPPKVTILDCRNEYLEKYPETWAYYDPEVRVMYILKEHDHIVVRIHEYGHWINACIYFILEIIWEFFWWGLGARNLVKRKSGKISK